MSLVLSRRVGESLLLYVKGVAPITLKVQSINKFGDVRFLIDAPKAVNVVRDELLGRMAEKEARDEYKEAKQHE